MLSEAELERRLVVSGWTKTPTKQPTTSGYEWLPTGGGRVFRTTLEALSELGGNQCQEIKCLSYYGVTRGEGFCFDCEYWHHQSQNEDKTRVLTYTDEGLMHQRNSRPRPGHGGLWYQGVVPKHLEHLFANKHDAFERANTWEREKSKGW